jgi:hypothetical protein
MRKAWVLTSSPHASEEVHITSLIPEKYKKKGIQEAIEGLKVTAKLGAKVMLHTLGSFSPDLYYEDAYSNAVKILKGKSPREPKKRAAHWPWEMVWNGFFVQSFGNAEFNR